MTALKAPPTGRESDCIFNKNKLSPATCFCCCSISFVFCSNSLGVSIIFFFFFFWGGGGGIIEINTFIQQGSFKLIKSDDKDIYNITKYFYFR